MEVRFPLFGALPEPLTLPACAVRKNGIRVCVIGGGGTGLALAYDLSQRGFDVTLLEKGELTSGTTGRHHGQLHCGARYAWADRNIARECYAESLILSRIAGGCIEYNGGFFVALDDEEAAFHDSFVEHCVEAGIPASSFDVERLKAMEPRLSRGVKAAVAVPDGSFDAFRLALMFAAAAKLLGARILPWHEVTGFDISGGRLRAVMTRDLGAGAAAAESSRELRIDCDMAVSATGAWAGKIGDLAGISIPIVPAPGAMVAVKARLVDHVISRLRPPGDGDILVPQRGLSIIGTTQRTVDSPEGILPSREEIEFLRRAGAELLPGFDLLPLHAAWAAARPLAGKRMAADSPLASAAAAAEAEAEARGLSRDFQVLDHGEDEGIAGFFTVIGGKATVLRAMAEKTADILCSRAGVASECRTSHFRLPSWRLWYRGAER